MCEQLALAQRDLTSTSNTSSVQGAQLEPQLGSTKFALVVLELLVLSQAIMVMLSNAFVSVTAIKQALRLSLTLSAHIQTVGHVVLQLLLLAGSRCSVC